MLAADALSSSQDLETVLPRLRAAMGRGQFSQVQQLAEVLLGRYQGHRELLYLLAVAQRMTQQIPEALNTLASLEAYHPNYSRLFQERGHCCVFLRQPRKAIEAFETAVRLNPALPATWQALERLYRIVGRRKDSINAADHVVKLGSLPIEVSTARSMVSDGDLQDAETVVRGFLANNPDNVEALRLLATIAREFEYNADSEALLERVLTLDPNYHAARYDLVLALIALHKHQRAREESDRILAAKPGNQGVRVTYASILMSLGDVDAAIQRYRELIKEMPRDPELHQSLGHALKTDGQQGEAVAAYHRAIDIRPEFGEAYWSLANMKTYRFEDRELDCMRQFEAQPFLQQADRFHLCFALGKGLEDRADYEESFKFYDRGNALKKATGRYRAGIQEKAALRQQEICTAEFFAARQGWGCQSAAPIFVLGMPRAGSTLIEQILASHSQVEGTMELANIQRLVGSLGRGNSFGESNYPNVLTELTAEQCRHFGDDYIRDTMIYRTGKTYFIDKMPNNFRCIGLIQLMLPNAKIIDARRNAMDCCFSNFKQLYANGHEFAYSLDDIGRYYSSYVGLMSHWDRALPGRVLCVNHEDVLADLEGSVRRILDYCGLPFETACVEFHKNQRRVHTASAEQVRRPINRDGVDQWKPYERWLDPLKAALGGLAS